MAAVLTVNFVHAVQLGLIQADIALSAGHGQGDKHQHNWRHHSHCAVAGHTTTQILRCAGLVLDAVAV